MGLVLFDTNIFIDHFAEVEAATDELNADYDDAIISVITWMEVACKLSPGKIAELNFMLSIANIRIVHTDDEIMVNATALRSAAFAIKAKNKLPDFIIRATAEVDGRIVITRNPGDFGGEGPLVRVPYDLIKGKAVNIRPPLV